MDLKLNITVLFFVILVSSCSEKKENGRITTGDTSSRTDTSQKTKPNSGGNDNPSSEMTLMMEEGTRDMKNMKMTGNVDRDFTEMMIMHHEVGIEMAEHYLKNSKSPELRTKAEKMIEVQKEEIQKLEALLDKYDSRDTVKKSSDKLMEPVKKMEGETASMKMYNDIDKDFANMMIKHHNRGMEMAKVALKEGKNTELRKIIEKMIQSQQKDIKELEQWMNK